MNFVRQREKLKELHAAGMMNTKELFLSLNSPVFVFDASSANDFTPDEIQFLAENIYTTETNVPGTAPFEAFRLSTKEGFYQWLKLENPERWQCFTVYYKSPTDADAAKISTDLKSISGLDLTAKEVSKEIVNLPEMWVSVRAPFWKKDICDLTIWTGGKMFAHDEDSEEEQQIWGKWADRHVAKLTFFVFQVMMPGNTILKVEPPEAERSIEWRMARTHYLILNHHQAKSCQQSKKPATEDQIVRAAHWRRAHFRRLVADRYKNKGSLVAVRQAWVGPKEWIGLDKKIYKVIELENRATAHQNNPRRH